MGDKEMKMILMFILMIALFATIVLAETVETEYIITASDDVYIREVPPPSGNVGDWFIKFPLQAVIDDIDKFTKILNATLEVYYFDVDKAWSVTYWTREPPSNWNEQMNCSDFTDNIGIISPISISTTTLTTDLFQYYEWNVTGTPSGRPAVLYHLNMEIPNITFFTYHHVADARTCNEIYNTTTLVAQDDAGKDGIANSTNSPANRPILRIKTTRTPPEPTCQHFRDTLIDVVNDPEEDIGVTLRADKLNSRDKPFVRLCYGIDFT